MFDTKRLRPVAALAAALALAACETDSTGIDETAQFDAQAALLDYEAMDRLLTSSGWDGFGNLGRQAVFATLGTDPGGAAGAPIISENNRGATFVLDPETGEYVRDESRTDAPASGVRFILYDESSGEPDPASEIGYADLIDLGDGSAEDIALRFVCVQDGIEILDYSTTLDQLGDGGAITVDGVLQDGTDALTFDIDVSGSSDGGTESVDIQFSMGMESRDFQIEGSVFGTEGSEDVGEVDVSVSHGDESLRVQMEGTNTALNGTFYLNGEVFATATGHPDDPVFAGADGAALTTIEAGVLIQMVGVLEEVFGLFEGLLAPVEHLVELGIVL